MVVYMGPLQWYGSKRFATLDQANEIQALLAMEGIFTVVSYLAGGYRLLPATESQIAELNKKVDAVGSK